MLEIIHQVRDKGQGTHIEIPWNILIHCLFKHSRLTACFFHVHTATCYGFCELQIRNGSVIGHDQKP